MKSFKALTLILAFLASLSLYGEEEGAKKDFLPLSQALEILNNPEIFQPAVPVGSCVEAQAGTRIKIRNCEGVNLVLVEEMHKNATLRVKEILNKIKEYRKKAEVRSSRTLEKALGLIEEKLICVDDKLKEIRLKCHNRRGLMCSDNAAYIVKLPFFNKTVHLCPRLFEGPIEGSVLFNSFGSKDQAGVLVHEVSHLCGVDDDEFIYNEGRHSKDFSLFKSDKSGIENVNVHTRSADYYEFWSVRGFCLPGFDCPKAPSE